MTVSKCEKVFKGNVEDNHSKESRSPCFSVPQCLRGESYFNPTNPFASFTSFVGS